MSQSNKITVPDVTITVDIDDVLAEVSASNIVSHFEETSDLDSLLDAIGITKCCEYFNLVEKKEEPPMT